MLQTSSSPERTGRVLSTGFGAITACNAVGSLVAGVLAAHWGAAVLLNGQALLILVAGAVALYGLVLRQGKADLAVAGR
jgi:predicted MFS family arabinose efflux permease